MLFNFLKNLFIIHWGDILNEIIPFVINVENQNVFGIFDKPKYEKKFPAIIIFHGFTGNHVGSQFKLSLLAKELSKLGIASVRFDFRGSGNSDGKFEDMTVTSETLDAESVIQYLNNQKWFNGQFAFLGYSMGAVIASSLIGKGYNPNSLVFWSPAFFNTSVFSKLDSFHETSENIDYKGFLIGRKFRKEILERDFYIYLKEYKNNVLVVHGNNDKAVDLKEVKDFSIKQNYDFVEIDGATHKYENSNHIKKLLTATKTFLKENLNKEYEK